MALLTRRKLRLPLLIGVLFFFYFLYYPPRQRSLRERIANVDISIVNSTPSIVASTPAKDTVEDLNVPEEPSLNLVSVEQCYLTLQNDQNEMDRIIKNVRFTTENPVTVLTSGEDFDMKPCSIPCRYTYKPERGHKEGTRFDAHFDAYSLSGEPSGYSILRNMESATNYPAIALETAHKQFDIVMTTRLDSDVPVPYFSWVGNDVLMRPPQFLSHPQALASAFISNCGASNFRLQALKSLQSNGIGVDSFGSCERNKQTAESKLKVIARYPFYLAFENSCELDYVTEKYFQALEVGTVPVVIGAPNILDFSPDGERALLHIRKMEDVPLVAEKMRMLLANQTAYREMLNWKKTGPSDSFKALVDLAVVHSSCRLCLHIADRKRKDSLSVPVGACPLCHATDEMIIRLLIRERGQYEYKHLFLHGRSKANLDLNSLLKAIIGAFTNSYRPLWTRERAQVPGSSVDQLRIYAVYPVGSTPRDALYGNAAFWRSNSTINEESWQKYLFQGPCVPLEVIFV